MNDQRHPRPRPNRRNSRFIQPPARPLLQMHIANRHRQGIHPRRHHELRGLPRICPHRRRPACIADHAQLTLARHPRRMGHRRNPRRRLDIPRQIHQRSVEHHRRKPAIQRLSAFLRRSMVQMHDNRHTRPIAQMPQHSGQHRQRRMRPASRPGLQDHRHALCLGRRDIGPHVFPAQAHQPRHGIAPRQGGLQHIGKRRQCHLNFAIMSLMPGIVSI